MTRLRETDIMQHALGPAKRGSLILVEQSFATCHKIHGARNSPAYQDTTHWPDILRSDFSILFFADSPFCLGSTYPRINRQHHDRAFPDSEFKLTGQVLFTFSMRHRRGPNSACRAQLWLSTTCSERRVANGVGLSLDLYVDHVVAVNS